MAAGDRNKNDKATDIDLKHKLQIMTKQELIDTEIAKLLGCNIEDIVSAWLDDKNEMKSMLIENFKFGCKSYNDNIPDKKVDIPERKNAWETLDLHHFRGVKIVFSAVHLDSIFYDKKFEQVLFDSINIKETNERQLVGNANFYIRMTSSIRNENDNNFFEKISDKIATKFIGTELDKDINVVNEITGKLHGELDYKIIITRTNVSIIYIDTLGYFVLENKTVND